MIVKVVKKSSQIIVYTLSPSPRLQTYVVAFIRRLKLIQNFETYKRNHCKIFKFV
jgi:hypothetical protein